MFVFVNLGVHHLVAALVDEDPAAGGADRLALYHITSCHIALVIAYAVLYVLTCMYVYVYVYVDVSVYSFPRWGVDT